MSVDQEAGPNTSASEAADHNWWYGDGDVFWPVFTSEDKAHVMRSLNSFAESLQGSCLGSRSESLVSLTDLAGSLSRIRAHLAAHAFDQSVSSVENRLTLAARELSEASVYLTAALLVADRAGGEYEPDLIPALHGLDMRSAVHRLRAAALVMSAIAEFPD
jgi:hypothetical protein